MLLLFFFLLPFLLIVAVDCISIFNQAKKATRLVMQFDFDSCMLVVSVNHPHQKSHEAGPATGPLLPQVGGWLGGSVGGFLPERNRAFDTLDKPKQRHAGARLGAGGGGASFLYECDRAFDTLDTAVFSPEFFVLVCRTACTLGGPRFPCWVKPGEVHTNIMRLAMSDRDW